MFHWTCPSCTNQQMSVIACQTDRSGAIRGDQSLETGNAKSGDHDSSSASDESSLYDILNSELKSSKGCLKIAHINCCGLLGKLNEIKLLVGNSDIYVLGLTETHLKPQIKKEKISIKGFCILREDRLCKGGGGCTLYYPEDLEIIPKRYQSSEVLETIWFEIILNSQRVLSCIAYRPPDQVNFYDVFDDVLCKIWQRRTNILIIGDLNSDLMKRKTSSELGLQGKRLKRTMDKYGLRNVISDPTRITEKTETLIDIIITSEESKIVKAGRIDPGISDHKLVYAVINLKHKRKRPQLREVKNYRNTNFTALRDTLENTPWWVSSVFDEVDDKLNSWELLYKSVINEYVGTRKAKIRRDSLTWMTTDLRKLLNKRYRLLKMWQEEKNELYHERYKKARNFAKKEFREAEANYWKGEFAKATNSKDFW